MDMFATDLGQCFAGRNARRVVFYSEMPSIAFSLASEAEGRCRQH